MGKVIQVTAPDGFALDGYRADPAGDKKGAVLVIQEIFGVNSHIREVCDGYAAQGYVAVAPAIFDRVEKNVELGYEGDDMTRGIDIAFSKLDMPTTLGDLQATVNVLKDDGKVGVVGYCFGGLLTWLSACNLEGIACAAGYYGGGIVNANDQEPKVPTILHFGDKDAHIPLSDVDKIKAAHPDVAVYVYEADHGFNCDHRASYDAEAASTALKRTLDHFASHIG